MARAFAASLMAQGFENEPCTTLRSLFRKRMKIYTLYVLRYCLNAAYERQQEHLTGPTRHVHAGDEVVATLFPIILRLSNAWKVNGKRFYKTELEETSSRLCSVCWASREPRWGSLTRLQICQYLRHPQRISGKTIYASDAQHFLSCGKNFVPSALERHIVHVDSDYAYYFSPCATYSSGNRV
jgi:hypothetical protein